MAQITVTFESYEEMVDFAKRVADSEGLEVKEAEVKELPYGRQIAENFPEANTKTEDRESTAAGEADQKEEETYTLIDVRTTLAKLNKAGKKPQVQELLKSFGADKLSQIPEEKYAEVMRRAGEL